MSDVLLFSLSLIFIIIILITFYFIQNNNKNNVVEKTVFYPDRRHHHRHHNHHIPNYNGCRCMRQSNGGTRGFCGICGSGGTTFGCPDGQNGCSIDCSQLKYPKNVKPCDHCNDPNCDLDQQPVYEGFGLKDGAAF